VSKKYNLVINNQNFEVEILNESNGIFQVNVNGSVVEVKDTSSQPVIISNQETISQPSKIKSSEVQENKTSVDSVNVDKSGQIKAMMPGKVLEILIKIGDEVSNGTPLLVIESMKMENTINSSLSGKVSNILVKVDDSVQYDQVMIEIE
tara:strand:+ start:1123 stop:1569 length:447 start_codon:yes stop_codon:yes gene_type:complete